MIRYFLIAVTLSFCVKIFAGPGRVFRKWQREREPI
jgi:hypothetical protein